LTFAGKTNGFSSYNDKSWSIFIYFIIKEARKLNDLYKIHKIKSEKMFPTGIYVTFFRLPGQHSTTIDHKSKSVFGIFLQINNLSM